MRVYVEFLGYAAEKVGRRWMWVELEAGSTLRDLFAKYVASVAGREVAEALLRTIAQGEVVVAINGRPTSRLEQVLEDGDRLVVFPLAAGGS